MNSSSAVSPSSSATCEMTSSNFKSTALGGSTPGKRSFIRPMKTVISMLRILGTLKSRSALKSTSDSAWPSLDRSRVPATTSTDLMALRPQS